MAVGDYYQARAKGTYLGQPWENVWWFYHNSGSTAAPQASDIADKLENYFYDGMLSYLVTGWNLAEIAVTNYNNPTEVVSVSPDLDGTVATAGMPSWVNYTLSWNRSGAGYNYPMKRINGVPEANTDGNSIESAVAAAIATLGGGIDAFTTADGANMLMFAINPTPEIGDNPFGNPLFRSQFPTVFRAVKLGTQKTRKP